MDYCTYPEEEKIKRNFEWLQSKKCEETQLVASLKQRALHQVALEMNQEDETFTNYSTV